MKFLRAFTEGFLLAVGVIVFFIAILAMAGCANGVTMSDEERITCRNESCTVWSERELQELANKVGKQEYRGGWIDATKQGSAGL